MVSRQEFGEQIGDAYEHLYDLVYLRTHPLTDVLVAHPDLQRKEKAWRLHRLLLEAIEELDPGPQAPAFSHEWRRHRLMVLRYLDGLDPPAIADQIAISRRHYGADVTRGPLVVRALFEEPPFKVGVGPRVGIRHCADWPLRFFELGNPFVSRGAAEPETKTTR